MELGAGCGLLGITLSGLGAEVWMTDRDDAVLQRLEEKADMLAVQVGRTVTPCGTPPCRLVGPHCDTSWYPTLTPNPP